MKLLRELPRAEQRRSSRVTGSWPALWAASSASRWGLQAESPGLL